MIASSIEIAEECLSLGPLRSWQDAKIGLNMQEFYSCKRNSVREISMRKKRGRDSGEADRPQYKPDPEWPTEERMAQWGPPDCCAVQGRLDKTARERSSQSAPRGLPWLPGPLCSSQALAGSCPWEAALPARAVVHFKYGAGALGHSSSLELEVCGSTEHKLTKWVRPALSPWLSSRISHHERY